MLKIDASIIKQLPYDKNAQVVMRTIVDFAKKMNYEIVAEFVSNKDILEEVKKFHGLRTRLYLVSRFT